MIDLFYLCKSILNMVFFLKWGCFYMLFIMFVWIGIFLIFFLKVLFINVLCCNDKKVFGGLYIYKVIKFC